MASLPKQVGILMHKNILLEIRRPITLVFKVAIPILLGFLLNMVFTHSEEFNKSVPNVTYFKPFPPSNWYRFPMDLIFAPNVSCTEEFMNKLVENRKGQVNSLIGFPNEELALQEMKRLRSKEESRLRHRLIIFKNVDEGDSSAPLPKHLQIKLGDDTYSRHPDRIFSKDPENEPNNLDPPFEHNDIFTLETVMGETVTRYWDNNSKPNNCSKLELQTLRHPFPPYESVSDLIFKFLHFILMMSFVLPVAVGTKCLVEEKECRIKEALKMMGMSTEAYMISWCIHFIIITIPITVTMTVVCCFMTGIVQDVSLFVLVLFLYAMSALGFCFLMSSLINKVNLAGPLSAVIFLITIFAPPMVEDSIKGRGMKFLSGIICNFAFYYGTQVYSDSTKTSDGLGWFNVHKLMTETSDFTLLEVIMMLLLDTVLYFTISWYLERVFPGEVGIPEKPNFLCMPSFWCPEKAGYADTFEEDAKKDPTKFEKEATDLEIGVQLIALRKQYGDFVAVDSTHLNLYKGQITALLGHNGAGKSTTMNMLAGFLQPTSGTALVDGYDIRKQNREARSRLAFCPQHDVLFELLTPREHLVLFTRLKDFKGDLTNEINRIIQSVNLHHASTTKVEHLSGGDKRKLSIAIALCGDAQVLIFDEPTAGLDITARREIWTALEEAKPDKTILLSTHYMDEADVLSERIAIMAHGIVYCCGSAMFLKDMYGEGYRFVIVKTADCIISNVTALVQKHIPNATFLNVVSSEITYLLPFEDSDKFVELFRDLENSKTELFITDFGVSATTLEDVYLSVDKEVEKKFNENDNAANTGQKDDEHHANKSSIHSTGTPGHKEDEHHPNKSSIHSTGHADHDEQLHEHDEVPLLGGSDEESTASTRHGHDEGARKSLIYNPSSHSAEGQMERMSMAVFDDKEFTATMTTAVGRFVSIAIALVTKRVILLVTYWPLTLAQILIPAFLLLPIFLMVGGRTLPKIKEVPLDLREFPGSEVVSGYYSKDSGVVDKVKVYNSLFNDTGHTIKSFGIDKRYSEKDVTPEFEVTKFYLEEIKKYGLTTFNRKHVIGFLLTDLSSEAAEGLAVFGGYPVHALPISVSYATNFFIQNCLGPNFSVAYSYHALRLKENSKFDMTLEIKLMMFLLKLALICSIPLYVFFPSYDKKMKSKQMQMLSGVRSFEYWTYPICVDFLLFVVSWLLAILILYSGGTGEVLEEKEALFLLQVCIIYGFGAIMYNFLISLLPLSPGALISLLIAWTFFTTMLKTLIDLILTIMEVGEMPTAMYVLIPHLAMVVTLDNFTTAVKQKITCTPLPPACGTPDGPRMECCPECDADLYNITCYDPKASYWNMYDPEDTGYMMYIVICGVVSFLLVVILDSSLVMNIAQLVFSSGDKSKIEADEDEDIAKENAKVQAMIQEKQISDALALSCLTKVYCGGALAVDNISVGVKAGECFGLLGLNGAGKTTTFKMMTGETLITSGDCFINGHSVKKICGEAHNSMGYCSQDGSLINTLTVKQTLTFYCRLKGIVSEEIPRVVNHLMDLLLLSQYKDRRTERLSGGNKRKTAVAIALVGYPNLVMLDEPSAGMDPKARRTMWGVLFGLRHMGNTMVLTSHSMDECEALCTRLVFMLNGKFLCLGSPQYLKNKFAQGYTVVFKMETAEEKEMAENTQNIIDTIQTVFSDVRIFDQHSGYIHFQVTDKGLGLADVFEKLEQTRNEMHVESYTVQQTTLEQLFLAFTKDQKSKATKTPLCFCF